MDLIPKRFFLDDFFNDEVKNMKCDIYHNDEQYFIEMDLPGINKENINISYDKGYINISVNNENNNDIEEKTYIRRERKYFSTQRSFYVGEIKEEEIKAQYKDGILKIIIPKEEYQEQIKKIEIE